MGFVLAAVGSAVGLGNMWRFPYFAAENGGAAFLFLYIIMVALVGLPIMLAEFAIGRGAKKSPIQALEHFGGPAWKPLGVLFVFGGFLILSYYSVIAGWTLRYALHSVVSGFGGDFGGFFSRAASGWDAVGWHLLFMGLTVFIVAGGIRGGIERSALILMPLLFLIVERFFPSGYLQRRRARPSSASASGWARCSPTPATSLATTTCHGRP